MLQTGRAFFPSQIKKSLITGLLSMLLYIFLISNPVNAQWVPTNGTTPAVPVKCFIVKNNILFAGTWAGTYGDGGAFRTTNNGTNWIAINSGLTDTAVMGYASVMNCILI